MSAPVFHPDVHKLGKADVKHDDRNLKFAAYLTLPGPPGRIDYGHAVASYPMYGNDEIGDCVLAGAGHEEQVWTAIAGSPFTPPESAIIQAYSAITGYRPGHPETDQGTVVLDALNYRRHIGISGRRLDAYAQVDPKRTTDVKSAVYLFGAVGVGLALPVSAQRQSVWKVARGKAGEPGSWGGHYVPIVGYDHEHLTCITWGRLLQMTWGFFHKYCDEAYALLSPDFLRDGRSPAHFDLDTLRRDLAAL